MAKSLLPAGIDDDRSRALEAAIGRLGDLDLTRLLVYYVDSVEASALPHLVDQFDLHDFVDDTTSETTVRRLLKRAIELRRYNGTPWAVKQALEAAGIKADLKEWWQQEPKGTPNTFSITAYVTENMGDGDAILSDRRIALARRFISAAKRASQQYDFKIGARFDQGLKARCTASGRQVLRRTVEPPPHEVHIDGGRLGATAGAASVTVARRTMDASAPHTLLGLASTYVQAAGLPVTLLRVSMEPRA